MKTLRIYDPPLCCPSGVCGPSVDPALTRIAADIAFLKSKDIAVERFNLAHHPQAFLVPAVIAEMGSEGENLPLVMLDEKVITRGRYPSRYELADLFEIDASASEVKSRVMLKMAGPSTNQEGS